MTLSNHAILRYASERRIPYFRGVYMLDTLPKSGVLEHECGIVNLDNSKGSGTHWVSYYKHGSTRIYFDSFGQITPLEIQKYLKTEREFSKITTVILRIIDIFLHFYSCYSIHFA